MKKYVKIDGAQGVTHLKIETAYTLGGYNYFTGGRDARGYYLHVSPVERSGRCETYVAFTGAKQLLKPVNRKSAKAEAVAEDIAANYVGGMVRHVCAVNGLQVPAEYKLHPEVAEWEGGVNHD